MPGPVLTGCTPLSIINCYHTWLSHLHNVNYAGVAVAFNYQLPATGIMLQAIFLSSNLIDRVTEDLYRLFSRFGDIRGIQIYSNKIVDRFAVIVFCNPESADKAKVVDGLRVYGGHITVE
jgi:hypothetical protein